MASTSASGLSRVRNLLRARKQKQILREQCARKNRGVGSVKMGYSENYFSFHSQSLTNIQHAYNTGDRSEQSRRLTTTKLRSLPPLEMLEDPYELRAIEYHKPSAAVADEGRSGAKTTIDEDGGEQGWQFATAIDLGDDNEPSPFENTPGNALLDQIRVQMNEAANSTAVITGNRALSMLDSAFGSDVILADTGMPAQNDSRLVVGRATSVDLAHPMQAANVYTSSKSSIWEDGVSQQYTLATLKRAPGIKERAWDGIVSTDGLARIVHNPLNNKYQSLLYRDKSDDLPVALQTVPKELYVNSDARLRRTEDV